MSDFFDCIDTIFVIEEGKIKDKGEDSYGLKVSEGSAYAAVFDGSGGMGSKIYPEFDNHTGAYVASRLISKSFSRWYEDYHNYHFSTSDEMIDSISSYFKADYKKTSQSVGGNSKIGGSMVRDFPTTAAIALISYYNNAVYLNSIWAGDSRVYIINDEGLAQVTIDDVGNKDAFMNLREDGAMTNVLASDGRFELHLKSMVIDRPTIVFSATDGCFGYISSPMEFEYTFLEVLASSSSIYEFMDNMKNFYRENSGDDFALAFMAFHYGSFGAMRDSVKKRLDYLKKNYIEPIEKNRNDEFIGEMWKKYKPQYERLC